MKTASLFALALFLFGISATAQVADNVGSPPAWGPVGYAKDVGYYYLPDIESYYDLRSRQFIYNSDGNWVRAKHLPPHYRRYNLYSGYKVVLADYRGSNPYVNFKSHRVKYYKGYREGSQKSFGHKEHRGKERHFEKENGRKEHHENHEARQENKGHGNGHGNH